MIIFFKLKHTQNEHCYEIGDLSKEDSSLWDIKLSKKKKKHSLTAHFNAISESLGKAWVRAVCNEVS